MVGASRLLGLLLGCKGQSPLPPLRAHLTVFSVSLIPTDETGIPKIKLPPCCLFASKSNQIFV